MPVEAIGQIAGSNPLDRQSQVNLDDFMEIFLTQLSYQDPLEPVDNREFLAQLAQFSSLQVANVTSENMDDMLQLTAVDQSIGLLGRQVEIEGLDSNGIIGEVTTIRFQNGSPLLSGTTESGVPFVDLSPTQIRLVR
jgi:flagellar basal-body rod modification protein FlgD